METMIACFIAGISISAFFTLWFVVVYRELSGKKRVLDGLEEQVDMHSSLLQNLNTNNERKEAERMIKTSVMIYNEAVKSYCSLLHHPFYRFPGFVMGFRCVKQKEQEFYQVKKEVFKMKKSIERHIDAVYAGKSAAHRRIGGGFQGHKHPRHYRPY